MKRMTQLLLIGLGLAAGLASLPAAAAPHVSVGVNVGYPGYWHAGYWRGGYWRGGYYGHPYWRTGWAVGLGVDLYPYPAYPVVPAYAVVPAAPPYYEGYAYQAPPPPRPHAKDPQFTPRFGQSAWQTEADRQACNRWATTQPEAMADAAEFHRKSLACMEGRGYEVK